MEERAFLLYSSSNATHVGWEVKENDPTHVRDTFLHLWGSEESILFLFCIRFFRREKNVSFLFFGVCKVLQSVWFKGRNHLVLSVEIRSDEFHERKKSMIFE